MPSGGFESYLSTLCLRMVPSSAHARLSERSNEALLTRGSPGGA
eukprot:CAMPEP_0119425192 /NCGR_PEP_ID=MMETSP1335-20130426/34083_1 /TAXON_ID=259385 /ORGANISM="Chrysoculter rhomboideus, Strain RCC1486" /LENGTH=43 /DNA_ID= /DNA_START= /DNA_END= /DNA_ORIENTATION=